MIEKIFELEGVEHTSFFGVRNSKIELIKSYFPKLIITARGHNVKVKGDPAEIEEFTTKFQLVLDHYYHYNSLSEESIHQIMMDAVTTIEQQFPGQEDILLFGNSGKPIRARTPNQRKLVEKAKNDDLIFAIGPAGSGKTYTAIALAVRALKNREIKRIILSRPAVEAGENLGFLPGDLKEKIDPYLQPLYDALLDMIPPRKLEEFLKDGVIQIAPLAFMRGRTLSNAYVILDEAQNTSIPQLKMFLTRMGLNTKYVITGDITQIDLPKKQPSGLIMALRILKNLEGISIIEFDKGDIIRHRLVRDIVEAYDRYDDSK
ncbi:PhoH family protein [Prolixibacter denitrificans]|uniref:PhoH-like protein n=1 Tax=Prolixibacter denitrificans TaxID=1541063 RepID=A0A2P8CAI4_9BACT|nr:PhoH family protein [Prolixibacter denitrificans]PSK81967.1 phosphate starvation-inducible protein PhoH [Prolixibacter denitrificans]GET22564.1 phosphate starvation protein PhoH [Prolixibacter denitrificans]